MPPPRRLDLVVVVTALSLVFAATGMVQDQRASVTVADVIDGSHRPDQTELIGGERIAAVGSVGDVEVQDGAPLIDGAGQYLSPGLWYTHVHTSSDGITRESLYPFFIACGETAPRTQDHLEAWPRPRPTDGTHFGRRA